MSIVIREADLEVDALAIMDGARDFASRISFRHLLPNDDQVFVDAVSKVVTLKGVEILLAEHDGRVVGGIGILFAPYLWNPDRLVADEIFWWTYRDSPPKTGRLLLQEAMMRIDGKNAIPMFRKLTTSPPGVERAYLKIGLEPIETVFTRMH